MTALLIYALPPDQTQLVAQVADTDVQFSFIGDGLENQLGAVRYLGAAMQQGVEGLTTELMKGNILNLGGEDGADVVQSLFNATDRILFPGETPAFIVADVGDFLIDELFDAGVALFAA